MPHLQIKPELEALPQLYAFCEEQGVDPRTMLALEEAFVNVCTHSGATDLFLSCQHEGVEWVFVLEDDGVAFDPTIYAPSPTEDDGVPKTGGQGIRIMQSLVGSLHYRRENNKNILTLKTLYKTKI